MIRFLEARGVIVDRRREYLQRRLDCTIAWVIQTGLPHNPDEPEPKRFKVCDCRKNLYLTVYHCAAYVLIGGLQIIFRNPQSVKKNI